MHRFLLGLVLGAWCVSLPAAVYYVDQNQGQANDNNAGTVESLPWKTVTKAANTARAGDTVLVKAGTYNENLTPLHSGTPGNLITFKAYPADGCVDAGPDKTCGVKLMGQVYFRDGNDDAALRPNGLSYIRIEGFEIIPSTVGIRLQNSYYDPGSVSTGVEIVNNYIHDPRGSCGGNDGNCDGISAGYVRDLTIMNNAISRLFSNGSGIFVGGYLNGFRSTNILIKNNRITDMACDGIRPYGNNVTIEGNEIGFTSADYFTQCHQDGIEIYGPNDGLYIINNKIWDWTQNIYPSAEHPAGFNIENVDIIGNVVWNKLRGDAYGPNYTKGVFGGSSTAQLKNVRIIGNTFYNNYFGISCGVDSGSLVIRNNIIAHSCASLSQNSKAGTTVSSDYNLFYGHPCYAISWGGFYNTLSDFRQANPQQEQHSLAADPQFLDTTTCDFHLQSASPAREAGDPSLAAVVTLPLPYTDIDGNVRPQGARSDMGAYEYMANGMAGDRPGGAGPALAVTIRPNALLSGREDMVIEYTVPWGGKARLGIYNTKGQSIRQLTEGVPEAGPRRVVWDGKNEAGRPVPGGIYYLFIKTARENISHQLAVLP